MSEDEPGFTLDQAMRAQRQLRAELGLGEERFPLPAFIGMISDEIEQMRQSGRSDADIIAIIEATTGYRIDGGDLERHYAPPEQRRRD